jgi:hypothetical protein
MRLIAIALCLIGCGCLGYQTVVFGKRLDSAVEEHVFLVQRYAMRLTPDQAVMRFRALGNQIDSFRPALWPGVILVLMGAALLIWKSSVAPEIPARDAETEPAAGPNSR